MRHRLRTLLILLAIGPPMLAMAWIGSQAVLMEFCNWQQRKRTKEVL